MERSAGSAAAGAGSEAGDGTLVGLEDRRVDGKVELWDWVRGLEEGRTGMEKRKD